MQIMTPRFYSACYKTCVYGFTSDILDVTNKAPTLERYLLCYVEVAIIVLPLNSVETRHNKPNSVHFL